jgi:hypothetical protein
MIREAIRSLQLAKITLNHDTVYIKAKPTMLANKMMKLLNLKQPKNLSTPQEMEAFLKPHNKCSWGQLSFF